MQKNSHHFDPVQFCHPDTEFAPIYSWVWNAPITEEKITEQLDEMRRLGIRAFYIIPEPQAFRPGRIPTTMEPGYLTSVYFNLYRFAMDKAMEYGMQCWLYDEGGWPSGGACGKVMLEHPEYAKRTLGCRTVVCSAGNAYKKSDSDTAASFTTDHTPVHEGEILDTDTEILEYYSLPLGWREPAVPDYPDLTRKEATQAFLNITHDAYKPHLQDLFGKGISAVFTDEPMAPHLPFREELCALYEEKYGESILPHLPLLAGRIPADEQNTYILQRWFDLCSQMFCDNYLSECRKWCHENGLDFTGHLNVEDTPMGCMQGNSYHILRGLRCMDIPGIDVIWRQIFPGEKRNLKEMYHIEKLVSNGIFAENRFFPRYAASAAAQNGGYRTMSESFGVFGSGLTFDQMRFVLGFQAIRGINIFNIMLISLGRRGFQMSGELPAFAENQACHGDLGVINAYMERLSYLFTCGDRVCDTALYYPVNNYWGRIRTEEAAEQFENLGHTMERAGIDFDIVDDDILTSCETTEKGIIHVGKAAYRTIVIPESAYLPEKTRAALEQFKIGGGVVLYTAEGWKPAVEFINNSGKIRTMTRVLDDGKLFCFFNEDVCPHEILIPVNAPCYQIDVTEGKIYPVDIENGAGKLVLESGETKALYCTDTVLAADDLPQNFREVGRLEDFTFRKLRSYVIGEMEAEERTYKDAPVPVKLGEWSELTGRDFSGSCLYQTEFSGTGSDMVLDLGEVRHTCEVFCNGTSLGVKVMKPYRYLLPASLLQDVNALEIRVSNTPGNQHQFTNSFRKWGAWQLTPYHDIQKLFDIETLDSGLYGPVLLYSV